MGKFVINGGKALFGEVRVQTSKNATLPILSASLMCNGVVRIDRVPKITDVDNMIEILRTLDVDVKVEGDSLLIDPRDAKNSKVNCELSRTMRSSVFLLGSTLSRFKTAFLSSPGGCMIGSRPIDIHINALRRLGVCITKMGEYLFFDARRARAKKVRLRFASVGATENIIQFACSLRGKTTILNPAREPEIVDLCNFLNLMGAKIYGAGTNKITIYGVDKLYSARYTPIGDRIVSGTLMIAVALTGGDVYLHNSVPYQNENLIKKLIKMGCQIVIKSDIIHISSEGRLVSLGNITTGCYPDFPTDLQSMITVLSTLAIGDTIVREEIFENRFLIAQELIKMGARVKLINNQELLINGVDRLHGAEVEARDLRGGAGLVLAGLIAEGETVVSNIHFIDRGYDRLEQVLQTLNADIARV